MQVPRRFLPSLPLLAAFEAAARTGSVTAAAKELNLTQSAVSRQIRALEEQLGVELFHRERQTIKLTVGGEGYAREIRDALRKISSASLNLRANPYGGTLNLAILPTFGTRWLAPRLPDFLAENPGITVNLVTKITAFDFRLEPVDAAIHFGAAEWPSGELALLRQEIVVPACSPKLREQYNFTEPSDIRAAPLLHLTSRPDAWERWMMMNGVTPDSVHGMLFDQFATATQAAIAGVGVALLPKFLIEEELSQGKLVYALDLQMKSAEAYYLVWPTDRASHPPLLAFKKWILAQTAADR
ncbi:LysR family transcriptional regulator [Rhizobium sp. LEGMi198b]|uniref:LysR family transcriptional regulator n=1 Tax=unclassified Rhizobium TaxID=2613769 RepID=UPI000CDF3139|nr:MULTISPECIES: LysR family transcriptional regulator [Rhizobium]AVA24576.1 LysR family transcriptional regulator protein [Rhizobium sp. NXC24]MDK4740497.1 LysR family transcriptional regulator [Rhizobium sp. CNPSo 3464]UWU24493.1 LysR family transcriptional regulator [Rhizobium tropici]WFU05468.1 LysR family transcriptional regulator [Rhizobium sp. CB3171]